MSHDDTLDSLPGHVPPEPSVTDRPTLPATSPDELTFDAPTQQAGPRPATRGATLEPGSRIGRYQIVDTLGQGGMGTVLRVLDPGLDRFLALKLIRAGELATPEAVLRFAREARATAQLHHPHIVGIHDFGEDRGHHYFTMDIVEGSTLAARLKKGHLPLAVALRLLRPVAEAVHYAHLNQILHRDIKPANILLTPDETPRLTDFGLAKATSDASLTVSGAVLGTPAYMAPEQAAGRADQIDARSDVYALGAIFYRMLAGREPFGGRTPLEVISKVAAGELLPPSKHRPVDREAEAVCLRAMALRPDDRYPTAAALADDLQRLAEGRETMARPLGRLQRLQRTLVRHRVACGVVLLIVGLNVFYIVRLQRALRRTGQAESEARQRATQAAKLSAQLASQVAQLERRDRARSARELAQQAARDGNPEQARQHFAAARKLAPNPFDVLRIEADYHTRHYRPLKAKACLEAAYQAGRGHVDDARLALVLLDQYWLHTTDQPKINPTDETRPILDRLTRLQPDSPLAILARAILVEDPHERLKLLNHAIDRSDGVFWQAHGIRARAYIELGRMEPAMNDLKVAVRAHPESADLATHLGYLYLARGRPQDAYHEFTVALSTTTRRRKRCQLHFGRALAASMLTRHSEASRNLLLGLREPGAAQDIADVIFSRQVESLRKKFVPMILAGLELGVVQNRKHAYARAMRGMVCTLATEHGVYPASRSVAMLRRSLEDFKAAADMAPEYKTALTPFRKRARRALAGR